MLLGSVAPIFAFLLTYFNISIIETGDKNLSFYVIAALVNLLLVRYYYRNELSNSARGVILITFIATMAAMLLGDFSLRG